MQNTDHEAMCTWLHQSRNVLNILKSLEIQIIKCGVLDCVLFDLWGSYGSLYLFDFRKKTEKEGNRDDVQVAHK